MRPIRSSAYLYSSTKKGNLQALGTPGGGFETLCEKNPYLIMRS